MYIKQKIILSALILSLCISGCYGAITEKTRKQVDTGISFTEVLGNPEKYIGKVIIFGGTIIRTNNKKEKSFVTVLQTPLDARDTPGDSDLSQGRFIVVYDGFLDSAVYEEGREVTVAGTILGKEVRTIDETKYPFPLIEAKEIYLWPRKNTTQTPYRGYIYNPWYIRNYWGYPFYY